MDSSSVETSIIKWHEEGQQLGHGFMLVLNDLEGPGLFVEYLDMEDDPKDRVEDYRREEGHRNVHPVACFSLRRSLQSQLDGSNWNFEL